MIGIFALFAFAMNLLVGVAFRGDSFAEGLIHITVLLPLGAALVFLGTRKLHHSGVRLFHFLSVLLISGLSMWDGYDSYYGLGFLIIAFVIAYKYGYLDRGFRWKTAAWLAATAVFIELSARFGNSDDSGASPLVIAFLLFFAGFFYMVYRSDIDRLATVNANLSSDLIKAKRERYRLEKAMESNDRELAAFREAAAKADISIEEKWQSLRNEFQITRKEIEVVQYVVQTGSSNIDIAELMGIKESTVKQHIHRVLAKMDARNRADLIVLTRDYLGN